jgi:hypothetical protein
MGLCVPQECCAKGCGVLRRAPSEGLELDVSAVLSSRGVPCALPPASTRGALLWACSPPHRRAAAAALLADVTASSRRKDARAQAHGAHAGGASGGAAARATALSEQGAALRDLLRLSASRGMPQGELLLRLIARIAPELAGGSGGGGGGGEEEDEDADEDEDDAEEEEEAEMEEGEAPAQRRAVYRLRA